MPRVPRSMLGETHPLLCEEFADDLNPPIEWYGTRISKQELPSYSNKKFWWRCTALSDSPCGHEWFAQVRDRSAEGTGCPCCAGKVVHVDGRNSLQTLRPDLAAELVNTEFASTLKPGSNKRMEWECRTISANPCGHRWKTTVQSRSVRGRGCPFCAGQALHVDKRNAMAITHPELASEFVSEPSGLTAWDMLAGAHKKRVTWVCKTISPNPCGNLWIAAPTDRLRGNGCPSCGGVSVHSDGRNSLAVLFPDIAAELLPELNDGISASRLRVGSNKRLRWKCLTVSTTPCGSVWRTSASHRTIEGTGCPACAGRVPFSDGSNSLHTLHPDIAAEISDDTDANKILPASQRRITWECQTVSETPCGHTWVTTAASRVSNSSGCPSCSGRSVHSSGWNSLSKLHPDIASELISEVDSTDLLPGSPKRLKWKCLTLSENPCGFEWHATPHSRTAKQSGCPVCAGQRVHSDGNNSLAVTHPELAKEFATDLNGFAATEIMAGSARRISWRCTTISETPCGTVWTTIANSRIGRIASGCPVCAGKQVHKDGRNSFATLRPDLLEEWDFEKNKNTDPERITVGSKGKQWWVCRTQSASPCGFSWIAELSSRTGHNGSGCPACAKTGFNPNQPATLYILALENQFSDIVCYKAGITNDPENRINRHIQNFARHPRTKDWVVKTLELVRFTDGRACQAEERRILRLSGIRAPDIEDLSSELFIENPQHHVRRPNH